MAFAEVASFFILFLAAATAIYAAYIDMRDFRIPNGLVLLLAGLFLLHAVLSGRWVEIHWNLALALLMFALMLLFYSRNWMGGGDVKILTVAFLWVGFRCAMPFAILLLLFSTIHVIAAKFNLVRVRMAGKRKQIAFAPTVAAAMASIFLLNCI